ncbi:MAG: alanine--glyoxylate aminotransferase family protein [Chloroflexi bacterium]|nr:alanine--glyoxylate aminotransferase family protein [Chloroflexota bacterium]
MMAPVIGYLDPQFLQLLDDTQSPLRAVFRTENDLTIPISGTGTLGMEAAVYNVVEPGDTVVVCVNGFFGTRIADMAGRCGAKVVSVKAEWGSVIEPEPVEAALRANPGTKVVCIVHAETSTGILQPLEEIARIAHEHGALLLVDAVTSLTGCELRADEWGLDVVYSATQKCLSAPPGMAPVTFSPQAADVINARRVPCASFYVDVTMLRAYYGEARRYHHTPPMTMLYALREALRIAVEEGLEPRILRHRRHAEALWAGAEAIGLTLHVARPEHRAPPITTVRVPDGIDEMIVRQGLLAEHNIEIGAGFGELQGKVWRIGLMGYASTAQNVLALLHALETQLSRQGFRLDKGAGVAAASRLLNTA